MDIYAKVDAYNKTLSELLDTHAPVKRKNKILRPKTSWYTPDIQV